MSQWRKNIHFNGIQNRVPNEDPGDFLIFFPHSPVSFKLHSTHRTDLTLIDVAFWVS